ncbi:MAG: MarR family winged helix-turn-helix transcriptional regulator [Pseudomonadota bacterium]
MADLRILPDDISTDIFVGNALAAFARALSDKIDVAWTEATGRTNAACYAINQIGCEPGSSIKTLSGMLDIEHSSLVRLLDHLERDGLIERVNDPVDKRGKRIFLSPKGEDMLTGMINARRRVIEPMTGLLEDDELNVLHRLIEKLIPAVVVGGDDQHYVCRICELEICPQEMCPVNLCYEEWKEFPETPFRRHVDSKRKTRS